MNAWSEAPSPLRRPPYWHTTLAPSDAVFEHGIARSMINVKESSHA
jgi:hypothetical protein